jgi:RHS repeat-associated protein
MPQLSEKPHQGFATKKTALHPASSVPNFRVTLGLRAVVVENGVREIYSARYYNPNTGRFMSRDPEDGSPTDPKRLHKYLYVGANPVLFIDPTGQSAVEGAGIMVFDLASVMSLEAEANLAVTGTIEIQEGTATIFVNLIKGVIGNPMGLNALFAEAAVSLGAAEMYIVATLANPQLENILINRYAWVQVGGQLVWYQHF